MEQNKIAISLRPWAMNDLDRLVLYANNKKIFDNLTDAFPYPYTKDDGIKFIEKNSTENPIKILAVIFNDEPVGSIGVFPDVDVHRKNAQIGYWIAEPFWGRGIGTEAILKMVDYCFKTFDIERIYALAYGRNKASQRALEKAGFKIEAMLEKTIFKNNEFLDEIIYARRR